MLQLGAQFACSTRMLMQKVNYHFIGFDYLVKLADSQFDSARMFNNCL